VEGDELQKKLDEAKNELQKLNDKVGALRLENQEKRIEMEKITKEIEEKGDVEQVKLNKEVESLKIELTRNNSRNDEISTQLGKLSHRKSDLKNGIKDIREKINELETEKKEMQKDISEKQQEKSRIIKGINSFKEKNKLDNIGDIEKEVEDIDQKSDALEKEVRESRESQHGLIREKDKILHDISTIDAQISKVLDVEKEHKNQLDELEGKRKEFKKATLELNQKLDEDSSAAAQLSSTRIKINSKEEELAKLNARQISSRELSYGEVSVQRIMQLKKPGVYGTVAELGNVDSKYALALEISAGPKLRSIVVENDRIASECIKFLKDSKLGVVTFLPLNKIKSRKTSPEIEKLSKANGSHGLAIDLVSFDNKFNKIFDYVFSDSVVVDNIDVARRLGIGNAKYVTLQGDLADKSGAMRGGFRSKRKQSLGFKEKDIAEEVDKHERMVNELRSTIDELEGRRIENEELIAGLRTKKANLEGEIIKTETSLHLDTGDLDASKDKKDSLKKYEIEVDKKINLVQEKISVLNKELALVKTEKQKLRSSIAELRNPALLAELNAFEEKLKELNEEVIKIDSDIKLSDTQSEDIYKNELDKTDKIIKQIEKDELEFKDESEQLIKDIKQKEILLGKKEELAQDFLFVQHFLFLVQQIILLLYLIINFQCSHIDASNLFPHPLKLPHLISQLVFIFFNSTP